MKKERKEFLKKFKVVIEDLLDNYENYTDEEKAKIQEVFQKVADLNKLLDKYDLDNHDGDRHSYWEEYVSAYGQFFDLFRY